MFCCSTHLPAMNTQILLALTIHLGVGKHCYKLLTPRRNYMNVRNPYRLVAALSLVICCASSVLAQISTAKVTGGVVEGVANDGIASFKGIPFAAPPVGDQRWRPPAPVIGWQGVRRADKFAPGCVQEASWASVVGKSEVPFGEDCLYLNV
jgi:para-nitrobenzyl esterase